MFKRKVRKPSNGNLVGKAACAPNANTKDLITSVSEETVETSPVPRNEDLEVDKENIDIFEKPSCSKAPRSELNATVVTTQPVDFTDLEGSFMLCGLDVNAEPSNTLNLDQAVFVKNLSYKLFPGRNKSKENASKFMISLKAFLNDDNKFLKALSPTMTASDCDVARGSTQDSVVRLLLQIEEIQTELANYLLDRLAELGLQSETNFDSEIAEVTPITWVKLILQPFRYLNRIVNSKNLCERLFDIIFSSPDKQIQQEVIIYLPDIIGDTEHYFATRELSKLLKSELELMPPVVDALTNLSVQNEICKEVRRDLIDTLMSSPIQFLPSIVKFLVATCDVNSCEEVLNGLRKGLLADDAVSLKNTVNEEDIDVEGVKVLIFNNIRNCLLANKQLADNWLKNISQLNREIKCRPLDLFITLIIYDVNVESSKKRSIETIIRSRIKNEVFSVALIDKTFEHHTPIIMEYLKPLISILSKLMKSVDSCIVDFVTAMYLACFKNIDQRGCEMIISELLGYIGAGDFNDVQTASSILSTIAVNHPSRIRPMAQMLKVLLDKLTILPLKDVLQLMDILCFITFSETNDETDVESLKTEITSLIEKQFSSLNISCLRIGVIAAVMTIKHIATVTDDETNMYPDKSSDDFEESHLSEKAKRAIPFLKLIIDATKITPEAQGFAFDQFSLMLKKHKTLDKSLMFYTSIVMKENMKKYFLICNDEIKSEEFIECTMKFNLNEDEEEEYVVLNLTPTLVEEMNCRIRLRMFVLILPSLLRLIRGLECEDLREIDGLLECPVIVPSPKLFEDFGIQTPEVQCVAMDSLFYLNNWFREIVNCFARMIKQPSGKKVLIRLRTLIWLQKMIVQFLPQMYKSDYCPPQCHFHKSVKVPHASLDKKKKKPPAKKKKTKAKAKAGDIRKHLVPIDSTIAGTSTTQCTAQAESDEDTKTNKNNKTLDMKNYKQFFRELDWDIWMMLSLPLTLQPEPEKDWDFKPEFGPSELLFIMEDLVEKIQYVLITSTKRTPFRRLQNEDLGLTCSSLYVDVPELFVKNLIKLTPRLCTHLEALVEYCQSLLTKNDGIFDATGMFEPETVEIKTAFSLILKSFSILFNWPSFANGNHQDLFVTLISKISLRLNSDVRSTSVLSLIKSTASYFAQFQETVLHFDCALNLVAILEILNKHAEACHGERSHDINKTLGKMCWSFLAQHWYDWSGCEERGPNFNKGIEHLLTIYFDCAHQKIKAIQLMFEWLREEVTQLNNKDSALTTLPNINKSNFNIILRVLLKTLATATKETIDANNRPTVRLELWIKVIQIMEYVVAILKVQSVRTNLICFVKGSSPILRLFLNNGLSVCAKLFRIESIQVSQLLKALQITTRYLQKIFDNTKLTEDSALCAYLPPVRSLLESILLKVKEIIVQNKCTEAFFVGSMRNKDLQGQDILSQSTVNEDSDRMDVDDDVPPGGDDDDQSIEVEEDVTNNDDETANNNDDEENENDGNVEVEDDVSNRDDEDEGNESEEIVYDEDEEEDNRRRKTPKNRRS